MTDDEIRECYASAPTDRIPFEVVSISASWFSKTYHLQCVFTEEIEVTLDTGETVTVDYVPMSLTQSNSSADLTYERTILIQWANDVIAAEGDNYDPAIHGDEMPQVSGRIYVYYRNGDISAIKGAPVTLPVRSESRDETGTTLNISAKPVNDSPTGEIFDVIKFPGLRGFQ